jgi:mRNA turnover protein 4
MEPQLRALGLHTTLVKGVPSLNTSHQLCKTGETLTSEQCRILKLLGVQMAVSRQSWMFTNLQEFRINLGSRWSKKDGFVAGEEMTSDEVMDED